jgi:hypothetical protein
VPHLISHRWNSRDSNDCYMPYLISVLALWSLSGPSLVRARDDSGGGSC